MAHYEINLTEDTLEITIGDVKLSKGLIDGELQDCEIRIYDNRFFDAVFGLELAKRVEMASELATDLDEMMTVEDFTDMELVKSSGKSSIYVVSSKYKPLTLMEYQNKVQQVLG